jgi:hypothetical protein
LSRGRLAIASPGSRLVTALNVNIANLAVGMIVAFELDDRVSLLRVSHGEGIIKPTRRINLE